MATEVEMMADLAAADAAGDSELAQHIAGKIKAARVPPAKPSLLSRAIAAGTPAAQYAGEKATDFMTGFARLGGLADPAYALAGAAVQKASGDERPFRKVWEEQAKKLKRSTEEITQRSPVMSAAGGGAGMLATAPLIAGAALAPTSYLARGAGLLPRLLAGANDAALFSAATAALNNPEKPATAAAEAAGNPLNAVIGAGLPMAAELSPQIRAAGRSIKDTAGRIAYKALRPQPGDTPLMREQFGSTANAGNAALDIATEAGSPIVPSFASKETRFARALRAQKELGPSIGDVTERADIAKPGAVNVDDVMSDVASSADRLNTPGQRIANGGSPLRRARAVIDRLQAELRGYVPTSTNFEFLPQQGDLPLPGNQSTIYAGSHLEPSEPGPPIAITYQVKGATPSEVFTYPVERPLVRGQQGTATHMAAQRNLYEGTPPAPERLLPDTMRPAPNTGYGVAREHVPAKLVQTAETANQGTFGLPPSPVHAPPAPGMAAPVEGPPPAHPTSTNVVPKTLNVTDALNIAREIEGRVRNVANSRAGIIKSRPEEIIDADPDLKFMKELANSLRRGAGKGVETALGTKEAGAFQSLNQRYGDIATLKPILENAANVSESGSTTHHFLAHPWRYGNILLHTAPVARSTRAVGDFLGTAPNQISPEAAALISMLRQRQEEQ
jgi:hypothetical protein